MSDSRQRTALRKQALSFLKSHKDQAYRPKEIAKTLGIKNQGRFEAFKDVLREMQDAGMAEHVGKGRIQYRDRGAQHTAEGSLQVIASGHGFVSLDKGGDDVFVRKNRMGTALNGDRVRIGLAAEKKKRDPGDLREAEILEVLERKTNQTVGTFQTVKKAGWVKPDDPRISHDVYVPREEWNGATPGDKVVVSIDSFDDPKASPEGRVLSVLGRADAPGVAVLALAMAHGAKAEFPPEVEKAASDVKAGITKKEVARRLDLRDYPIFTIDPVDAKDFDDAIHTRDLGDGMTELGIHIADVSHYVPKGGIIDQEAYDRATSTYLVDRVIPMLPEELSNGVCSLRPREDKLTYSVLLTVDGGGNVHSWDIRETVIHSKERFAYEDAQEILDGKNQDHPLAPEVLRAGEIAKTLTAKRMAEGAIDFDVPEIRVVLDDKGRPIDIITKERKPANRLIEEFMLLANQAVAKEAEKLQRPLVYRIHDNPDAERIAALADYVRPFGYTLPHESGKVVRADLNNLLKKVKGSPEAPVIEQAAIRAMSKAVYSPHNIGHYGLGFSHYAHFTSPIRRYPDLIVHRLLKDYLASGDGKVPVPEMDKLEAQAKHCSEREREATEAERESIKLKQVEYAEQHVGDSFEGVVVSVTKFGVFVELKELLVQGLVHVRDMNDDYWEYDPSRYELVGRYSGRRIRTGSPVKVEITGADTQTRQIDLAFVEEPGAAPGASPEASGDKGKKTRSRASQLSKSRKKSSRKKSSSKRRR
ncbi:ribonuclease R [Rubricoccus marinus]|uniref:Ribonuclease R n=1 Tax=Rubricoccus marinus TaxID=716817 RepID=A0A259TWV9_9BACT|nr:ribonuclease R [Rubricoccus marinus]OZC02176.1 ribonuclease R [Rubricoccus marinus]